MTFIASQSRTITMGRLDSKILIVGDCPDGTSIQRGRPFAGAAEASLEQCLHNAGMIKGDVLITNLIPDDTRLERYWDERYHKQRASIRDYLLNLKELVDKVQPKVIITLGDMAMWALTGVTHIAKMRGYPLDTPTLGIRVIPTLHPQKTIWSNHIWRYYIAHDFIKAKRHANGSEPPVHNVKAIENYQEAIIWLENILAYKRLSVDIEVANFEVSCISFAPNPDFGISVPFDMRWTLEEETHLWCLVAQILGDETITKVGQNFLFDIHFLALRMGIITRGPIEDTMMSHSIMYPDFLKSLNFLASIHTDFRYWKGMVDWKNIKKEA